MISAMNKDYINNHRVILMGLVASNGVTVAEYTRFLKEFDIEVLYRPVGGESYEVVGREDCHLWMFERASYSDSELIIGITPRTHHYMVEMISYFTAITFYAALRQYPTADKDSKSPRQSWREERTLRDRVIFG